MFSNFFKKLQSRPSRNSVFNPYRDERLLNNLKLYFEYLHVNSFTNTLLIGEAPGYTGCRLTGIPFTNADLILKSDIEIFETLRDKVVVEQTENEKTATIVWEYLKDQDSLPIFWNSFPFHPFKKYKPRSNRAPTKLEIEEGKYYIEALVDIFEPKQIAAVGRKGEMSLKELFPTKEIQYIRHPSYGGKTDFIDGMERLGL